MRLLHAAAELQPEGRPVCLALGVFDGVHLGHQRVIGRTVDLARECGGLAVVTTFDRHPNAVVAPERLPRLLYTPVQRELHISETGVDALLELAFTRELSLLPAEAFIRSLAGALGGLHAICVGAGFVFGHQRGGNLGVLARLGAELGFQAHGLEPVISGGLPVSSTRIREVVAAGSLDEAGRLLGRSYSLGGRVVAGDRLGRELGFPTANLEAPGRLVPPAGVYAGWTLWEGRQIPVVLNIGHRPTLGQAGAPLRVEAHLLDFAGDLYGRDLEVQLSARLRDEQRFESLASLREQIHRDVASARRVLGSGSR